MLRFLNWNARDQWIHLEAKSHTYTIKGVTKVYSVTTYLHSFFPSFNADLVIRNMRNSAKFADGHYAAMSDAEIKAQWSATGKDAAHWGTLLHKQIEIYYNRRASLVREFKNWCKETDLEDVDRLHQEALSWAEKLEDAIFPKRENMPKEYGFFLDMDMEVRKRLEPYRTEWSIFTDSVDGKSLAGQVDMVYKIKGTDQFALYDWKRIKEVKRDNPFEHGKGCLSHLDHCNYNHYCLQLNLYKYILETYYFFNGNPLVISEMKLVVLHPMNDTYQFVDVPVMEEVKEMIKLLSTIA